MSSIKYKDAVRILKYRLDFFRGKHHEARGKELMYRIVASEPELHMLEQIENQYEPTTYEYKPACFVPYITPEVCRHIQLIYTEKNLENAQRRAAGSENRQAVGQNSVSVGGGQPDAKRFKRESR